MLPEGEAELYKTGDTHTATNGSQPAATILNSNRVRANRTSLPLTVWGNN